MRGLGSKTPAGFAWIIAAFLLLSAGVGYRVLAKKLRLVASTPVQLANPLSHFPLSVGSWQGKDVPLSLNIQYVAGNDDYVNRQYINREDNSRVNLYVAYTARPRTMTGHSPRVCYPAGGWFHDETRPSEVVSQRGRSIPCLIHRFHMMREDHEENVVLNFYVVNGQITTDENVFSGFMWRTPNIAGNPARYVAHVQISSVLESSVRKAAKDMTDLILDFFPDENGKFKEAQYISTTGGIFK